jgi:hypothetical protein
MYGYQYFSHLFLVYIDHNPCLEFANIFAAMPTTVMLLLVPL